MDLYFDNRSLESLQDEFSGCYGDVETILSDYNIDLSDYANLTYYYIDKESLLDALKTIEIEDSLDKKLVYDFIDTMNMIADEIYSRLEESEQDNTRSYEEDIRKDFKDLISMVRYNGASHRGGRIPEAIPGCINQINIPDNMRLKYFDVEDTSYGDNLQMELTYVTQEPFDSEDANIFLKEVTSAFQTLAKEFDKPFSVSVNAFARDGHEYGKLNSNLLFNDDLNESNELKKMQKFNAKRQKGLGAFVKLNAGNVEQGNAMFNSAMGEGMEDTLTEKNWSKEVDKNIAFKLRDAIDNDDKQGIIDSLKELVTYIESNIVSDNDQLEDIKEDLQMLDIEDEDDQFNYILANVYDFLDDNNIWLPVGGLDESINDEEDMVEEKQEIEPINKDINIRYELGEMDKANYRDLVNLYDIIPLSTEEKKHLAKLIAQNKEEEIVDYLNQLLDETNSFFNDEEDIDMLYHDASEDELRKMGAFDNLNDEDE